MPRVPPPCRPSPMAAAGSPATAASSSPRTTSGRAGASSRRTPPPTTCSGVARRTTADAIAVGANNRVLVTTASADTALWGLRRRPRRSPTSLPSPGRRPRRCRARPGPAASAPTARCRSSCTAPTAAVVDRAGAAERRAAAGQRHRGRVLPRRSPRLGRRHVGASSSTPPPEGADDLGQEGAPARVSRGRPEERRWRGQQPGGHPLPVAHAALVGGRGARVAASARCATTTRPRHAS